MDHLWSPWRYQYVQKADSRHRLRILPSAAMTRKLVVYRGKLNFVVLNLYPYTTGHLMIVPYEHVDTLDAAAPKRSRK